MKPDRLVAVDILRGCAILGVLGAHFFGFAFGVGTLPWEGYWPAFGQSPWKAFSWLYFMGLGGAGVPLFFVLSGFCIHYSVRRQGDAFSVTAFYWQRWWRLYPAYFVALSAFVIMQGWPGWKNWLAHITFVHNLAGNKEIIYGISPSFWTLPVEFQLYLIYPAFLYIWRNWGMGPAMGMTGLITVFLMHVLLPLLQDSPAVLILKYLPFTYWFYWALGAYVAECQLSGRKAFRSHGVVIALLVPLFFLTLYFKPLAQREWSWLIRCTLSAFVLDAMLSRSWDSRRKDIAVLSTIGLTSYSLYLFHQPLIEPLNRICLSAFHASRSAFSLFGLCLPFVLIVLSILSWYSWKFNELSSTAYGKILWGKIRGGRSDAVKSQDRAPDDGRPTGSLPNHQ